MAASPRLAPGRSLGVNSADDDRPQAAATNISSALDSEGISFKGEFMNAMAAPSSDLALAKSPRSWTGGGHQHALTPQRPLTPCRSGPGSGRATPVLQRVVVSDGEGGSVLVLLRRELEGLESRLQAQIARARDASTAALDKTERLREVTIQHLEHKIGGFEAGNSRLEKKVAELGGLMRGLSDEMQNQIKRTDGMEGKVWEFRHAVEEEMRQRCTDLDTAQQEILSKCRVISTAGEDAQKRLGQSVRRLETINQERLAQGQVMEQALLQFQERLESFESRRNDDDRDRQFQLGVESKAEQAANLTRLLVAEQEVNALGQSLKNLVDMVQGDRDSASARMEEFEERLRGVRAKLTSQDEHYSNFDDRIRREWEGRFGQLHACTQDIVNKHYDVHERLETVASHCDTLDRKMEEFKQSRGKTAVYTLLEGHGHPGALDYDEFGGLGIETDDYLLQGAGVSANEPSSISRRIIDLRQKLSREEARSPGDITIESSVAFPATHSPRTPQGGHTPQTLSPQQDLQVVSPSVSGVDERVQKLMTTFKDLGPMMVQHENQLKSLVGIPDQVVQLESRVNQLEFSDTRAAVSDSVSQKEFHRKTGELTHHMSQLEARVVNAEAKVSESKRRLLSVAQLMGGTEDGGQPT